MVAVWEVTSLAGSIIFWAVLLNKSCQYEAHKNDKYYLHVHVLTYTLFIKVHVVLILGNAISSETDAILDTSGKD